MELMSRLRWIIIICVVALVFILLGWAFFSIASSLFGNGDEATTSETEEQETDVLSTNTATIYVQGPIVANTEHRSYKISVSSRVVDMKVYAQYGDKIIETKTYSNTAEAYENFLAALEQANVTERVRGTDTEDDYDSIGVCATGKRYILELDSDLRRWSTSCTGEGGTANFSMSRVLTLFRKQVPDFSDLTQGTGLR